MRVRVRVPQPPWRRSRGALRAHRVIRERRAAAQDARRTRRCRPGHQQDSARGAIAGRGGTGSHHATVCALTGDRETSKVAYGTEAGLFQRAGIPAVVCGPGDIEQAHKPDELVALDQLAACEAFLHKVVDSLRVA
ncbi:M20/M25/M40 family metallo-hydrolase [Cupriavidus basilensis]